MSATAAQPAPRLVNGNCFYLCGYTAARIDSLMVTLHESQEARAHARPLTSAMRFARRTMNRLCRYSNFGIDASRHFQDFYTCHCLFCEDGLETLMDGWDGGCINCTKGETAEWPEDGANDPSEGEKLKRLLCAACYAQALDKGLCKVCYSPCDDNQCLGRFPDLPPPTYDREAKDVFSVESSASSADEEEEEADSSSEEEEEEELDEEAVAEPPAKRARV